MLEAKQFLLWLYLPLSSFCVANHACPTHSDIKHTAQLDYVDYTHTHADMYFKVRYDHQDLILTFRLPGQAPFARPASSHYASASGDFDRGNINWGFTNHYRTDFATFLMKYIVFRNAYPTETMVDCLYMSTLEGYFLYGHIWMHKN